ncbi:MAG TPA: hypothetical protein VFN67_26305 [Polyangiales bacterium]|nr:hypothetical protein [Polyangiales bacterium]
MTHPRLETCATHGLRYDAGQHDGCVLCRRLREPAAVETGPSFLPRVLLAAAVGIGALALLYWMRASSREGNVLAHVPPAAVSCVDPLVNRAQKCLADCGVGAFECGSDCMNTLNDTLEGCTALPKLSELGMQLLLGAGESPGWSLVRDKLRPPIEALAQCRESRGTFTAFVEVRAAQILRLEVGTHQRDVAECIVDKLKTFDAAQLGGGSYRFIVRAQPPPGKAIEPPPRSVAFIPWEPTQNNKAPEEALSTQVLSADFQELQSALKEARNACTPNPGPSCAIAVETLAPHFAVLTPGDRFGNAPLRRYQLNNLGAGFDCVRVERKTPFLRNTAIAMFRPADQPDKHWLVVSPFVPETFPNLEIAETPEGVLSEFAHLHEFRSTELSVCFVFETGGGSLWRLGMVSYDMTPDGKPFDWHKADISAFGLNVAKPMFARIQDAIVKRDFDAVQRMLSAGSRLDGIKGPLALAIRARWPLEKLEMLLRAGAKPNDLDEHGKSGMHEAATWSWAYTEDETIAIMKLLKLHGGDINLMLNNGTPLHYIAQAEKREKAWETMIAMGADPYRKNDYGQTPMELHCICRR